MKKIVSTVLIPVAVGVAITLIVQRINRGAPTTTAVSGQPEPLYDEPQYA